MPYAFVALLLASREELLLANNFSDFAELIYMKGKALSIDAFIAKYIQVAAGQEFYKERWNYEEIPIEAIKLDKVNLAPKLDTGIGVMQPGVGKAGQPTPVNQAEDRLIEDNMDRIMKENILPPDDEALAAGEGMLIDNSLLKDLDKMATKQVAAKAAKGGKGGKLGGGSPAPSVNAKSSLQLSASGKPGSKKPKGATSTVKVTPSEADPLNDYKSNKKGPTPAPSNDILSDLPKTSKKGKKTPSNPSVQGGPSVGGGAPANDRTFSLEQSGQTPSKFASKRAPQESNKSKSNSKSPAKKENTKSGSKPPLPKKTPAAPNKKK